MRGHLAEDITGRRYGNMTVIKKEQTINGRAMWLCRCDCGNEKLVRGTHLRTGKIISCGCVGQQHSKDAKITHAQSNSRLYRVWRNMRSRCENPNVPCYRNYGGRGISVCTEWHDFSAFHAWAMATGYDPTAPYMQCTIDRINVNGNYEPSNCRWATAKEQALNTRRNKTL